MEDQIQVTTRKTPPLSIFVLYVILTMAIYLLPSTSLTLPYIPVALLMLASLPLIMIKKEEWALYGIMLIATTFLMFAGTFRGQMVDSINDAVRNLRYFIPFFWAFFALRSCNKKQRIVILLGFLAVTILILFNTSRALAEEPWIARLLAQNKGDSSAEVNEYRLNNVGGYSFSYMMGVVVIAIGWLFMKMRNIFVRIACILAIVWCYNYIIQTMYTTLLIATTVGLLLLLFFSTKSTPTRLMLLSGFIVLALSLPSITLRLSEVFDGSLLSAKFMSIHNALSGKGVDSLGSRPGLIRTAVENWLEHPLFGAPTSNAAHSLFFSLLEIGGLFTIGTWLFSYICLWRYTHRQLKSVGCDTLLFHICMIYFSMISIFNDTRYTFEITIAAFFIIPLLCSLNKAGEQRSE
jgi:hypothetical protein